MSNEANENTESVQPATEEAQTGTTGLLGPEDPQVEAAAEAAPEAAPAAVEEVAQESASPVNEKRFDPLFHEFEDEEAKVDDFYEKITADDIKELPTVAKRMLHNFRMAYRLEKQRLEQSHDSRESSYKKREAEIENLERDFVRRQAEFAAAIDDPRVREAMSVPDSELPDIMSEEGIQARINKGVGEKFSQIFDPMREAAQERRQDHDYSEFVRTHPELKNEDFKRECSTLVKSRLGTTAPLSTQDAYELVKARRIVAKQQKRASQERKARSESARQIKRSSVSGSPGVEDIPPEIKKQGAASIASWLQSNPEAAKRITNSLR